MERTVAIRVQELMLAIAGLLDRSIILMDDSENEDERTKHRRFAGHLLAAIQDDVLRPIHEKFPDLKPRELE